MKSFFGRYEVALSVLLLSCILAVFIGQGKKQYYLAKQAAEELLSSQTTVTETVTKESDSDDDSFESKIDKALDDFAESSDAFERIETDEDEKIGKGGIIAILLILYVISKRKKKK